MYQCKVNPLNLKASKYLLKTQVYSMIWKIKRTEHIHAMAHTDLILQIIIMIKKS